MGRAKSPEVRVERWVVEVSRGARTTSREFEHVFADDVGGVLQTPDGTWGTDAGDGVEVALTTAAVRQLQQMVDWRRFPLTAEPLRDGEEVTLWFKRSS